MKYYKKYIYLYNFHYKYYKMGCTCGTNEKNTPIKNMERI